MREHRRIVKAGTRWAGCDDRVRALLLKGSCACGEADERSDVDFVVVVKRGQLASLWNDRSAIAQGLGDWLGGFDEVAWQHPHTFMGFYSGPLKVDFSSAAPSIRHDASLPSLCADSSPLEQSASSTYNRYPRFRAPHPDGKVRPNQDVPSNGSCGTPSARAAGQCAAGTGARTAWAFTAAPLCVARALAL